MVVAREVTVGVASRVKRGVAAGVLLRGPLGHLPLPGPISRKVTEVAIDRPPAPTPDRKAIAGVGARVDPIPASLGETRKDGPTRPEPPVENRVPPKGRGARVTETIAVPLSVRRPENRP